MFLPSIQSCLISLDFTYPLPLSIMFIQLPCLQFFWKPRSNSNKYLFLSLFHKRVYLWCSRCLSLSEFCNCFFLNFISQRVTKRRIFIFIPVFQLSTISFCFLNVLHIIVLPACLSLEISLFVFSCRQLFYFT